MRKIIFFIGITLIMAACQSFTPTPEELAQQQKTDQINILLVQINQDIDARRLTLPKNNNAMSRLNELIELDPDHPGIDDLKKEIAQTYVELSSASFEKKKLISAQKYLNKAKTIYPDLESITVLETTITSYITEQENLARIRDAELKKKQAEIEKAAAETKRLKAIAAAAALEREKEKERIEHLTITRLNQTDINARSKLVGIALDKVTPEIIKKNTPIIIQTQSQRDYKWLSALLRTSIYFVDSDFALDVREDINLGEPPRIRYAQ